MSTNDRIERDIYIAADAARVWAVLTQPEHVAAWFGNGEPPEVDLRPGGRIVFDHGDGGEQGRLPAIIERVEPEEEFAFRWTAEGADDEAGAVVATLVEFTLVPEGEGTRLRVVESGFTQAAGDPAVIEHRYKANAGGWGKAVRGLATYVERADGEEETDAAGSGAEDCLLSEVEVMEAMEVVELDAMDLGAMDVEVMEPI